MSNIELKQESLEQVKTSAFGDFEARKKEVLAKPFDSPKEDDIKRILKDYSSMLENGHSRLSDYKKSILSPDNAVALTYGKEGLKFLKESFGELDSAYEEYETMVGINNYFKTLDKDLEKAFSDYLNENNILDETKIDPEVLKNDFKLWLDQKIDQNKIFRHMEETQRKTIKSIDFDIVSLSTSVTSSSIDSLEQELLVSNNISKSKEDLKKEAENLKYSEKKFMNKIFGLGNGMLFNKLDSNLSISTENYVVRGEEKKMLKQMRDIFAYFTDNNIQLNQVFNDLNKGSLGTLGDPEYISKIKELSSLKKDKYSYISRLWEILDDKSKTDALLGDETWKTLYQDLYVGNNEDLVSNKRIATKTLFDGLDDKDPSVLELKGYIKSLDVDKFFAMFNYAGIDSIQKLEQGLKNNVGNDVYGKMNEYLEKNYNDSSKVIATKFAQFIIKNYISRKENISSVDKTLDKVISGYVSGKTLIDIANAGIVMEKMQGERNIEDILNLLGNKNFDNKLDFNDGDIKTGLQFKEIVLTEMRKNKLESEVAVGTILAFSENLFRKMGTAYIPYVEKLEKFDDKPSLEEVFDMFKQDPGLLAAIGDVFTNSPVPVSYIMKYGEKAFDEYNKDWNNETLDKLGEDVETTEIIDNGFDSMYNKLLEDGLKDDQEIKNKLRLHYHGLMLDGSESLKAGTSLSAFIESKIGTLSATVGVVGSGEGAQVGIMLGWNNQINVSENTSIYGGLNGGISGPIWMPIAIGDLGISKILNSEKLDDILHASAEKKLSVGGNVTVLPLWSWGVSASYEKDKKSGIEKTVKSISTKTAEITKDVLTKLSATANGLKGLPDVSIENIRNLLQEKFPKEKNKSGELEQAATNIYRGLQYFGLDKTESLDANAIVQISDMMGEFYSTSWKNESMNGLDRFHVSKLGVGIQFLAGFYPIPTVVVGLTKYRNKVWENTENSKIRDEAMYSAGRGLREFIETKEDGNKNIDLYLSKINLIIDSSYKIVNFEKTISVPINIVKNDCNIIISKEIEDYVKIVDGNLIIPSTVDLSFMRLTGGDAIKNVLVVGSKSVTSDGMKVNINTKLDGDPDSFKSQIEETQEAETKIRQEQISLVDKGFEKEIESLFTNVSALQEAETITDKKTGEIYDSKFYYQMLSHLDSLGENGDIDDVQIDKAIVSLKMLDKMRGDNVLKQVIGYIDQNQTDKVKITWVMNKLKQFFAGEPRYSKMKLKDLFIQRIENGKEAHLSLMGPDKKSKFPEFLNKSELSVAGDEKFANEYISRPDLLGFTAFYRKEAGTGRAFSMTALGGVEIQPNTERIITSLEQKKESFDWFMNNFEKQKYEQEMLWDRVTQSLDPKPLFNVDVLKSLLKNSYEGKSIDIDGKNVKINFDVVFYLLGECANESLGLSIKTIDIETKEEPKKPKIIQNLYLGDSESTNESVYKDKKDVSIGFTFAKEKDNKDVPENETEVVDDPQTPENETEVIDLPELNVVDLSDVELNQITIDGTNYSLVKMDGKVYVITNEGLVQVYNNNGTPTLSDTVEIPVVRPVPIDLKPVDDIINNAKKDISVHQSVLLNNLGSDLKE